MRFKILVLCSAVFFVCSKNSTEPNIFSEPKNQIKLAGSVLINTLSGREPGANLDILFKYASDSSSTRTDQNGSFSVYIPDSLEQVQVIVKDSHYFNLNFLVTDFNDSLLLELDQIIYYFPAEPGTRLNYNANCKFSGHGIVRRYIGVESWEIISFSDNLQSGQLQCKFDGIYYRTDESGNKTDTTDFSDINIVKLYDFSLDNGLCHFNPGDDNPESRIIFDYFLNLFLHDNQITVGFPPPVLDLKNFINTIDSGQAYTKYTLKPETGFVSLSGFRDSVMGGWTIAYGLQ